MCNESRVAVTVSRLSERPEAQASDSAPSAQGRVIAFPQKEKQREADALARILSFASRLPGK
jgi:hypothetical protein